MAYNIKDVFYLRTEATVTAATANAGSAQLDLSAYIDPIARRRQKGTGLAVYKVHWVVQDDTDSDPVAMAETGIMSYGLLAGAGLGDNATGAINATETTFSATNALMVSGGAFYGPGAVGGDPDNLGAMKPVVSYVEPSIEVPYVIVRDNVCLVYNVATNFAAGAIIGCRLECAQISLDQSTLNQLLRTQTV